MPHKLCRQILAEINYITEVLIRSGLSIEQNYPCCYNKDGKDIISWSNHSGNSITLKSIPYKYIYKEILKLKNYNIKLIDSSLIQFFFIFEKNKIIFHKLSCYPNPDPLALDSFSEDANELLEGYFDNRANNVFPPIRFDYDESRADIITHPKSHFSIGQFEECRIPVNRPITPNVFMKFLLRNFYNPLFLDNISLLDLKIKNKFNKTIHHKEKEIIHFAYE